MPFQSTLVPGKLTLENFASQVNAASWLVIARPMYMGVLIVTCIRVNRSHVVPSAE